MRPVLRPLGDAGLTVEFGARIDPEAAARVQALDAALAAAPPVGLIETVPTYRSLFILFDPDVLPMERLCAAVDSLLAAPAPAQAPRRWRVPACYDPACGEDLLEGAEFLGLTPERLVALHSGADWRIEMYGFSPGCAYLSGCPRELSPPRRARPRAPTPPGAVMIAGGQGVILPNPMPTGWRVIARTPERMFRAENIPPCPFAVGDILRFEPVTLEEFASLEARAAAGERLSQPEGGA